MEIKSISIDQSKICADGNEYFSLFEKHIPHDLDMGSTVLLYELANMSCIMKIIALNPQAKYIIVGNEFVNDALKIMVDKCIDVEYKDRLDLESTDMKFDAIIMNPPYQRNLHLKILAEAIKHLRDEKSTCVNLSPILWIEDPHAHMKSKSNLLKFKNTILDKAQSIDTIDRTIANETFNIGLYCNLGIYVCKKTVKDCIDGVNFWKKNFKDWEIELFNKIYSLNAHIADKCDNDMRDGIRVPIACIAGNRGSLPVYKDIAYVIDGMKDGKDWTKCKNNGGYEKEEGIGIPFSIKFSTELEAQNFYDSWKTTFLKWLSKRFLFDQNIPIHFLPWMEDYSQPWDDARFYKFFNITPEEQKTIEKTMAKYT